MVRFPGENHELSRSGSPWHRVERLQHIVGWFDASPDSLPEQMASSSSAICPAASSALPHRKPGYAEGAYGRRRPGGRAQQLSLTDVEPRREVTLRIWKHGAIAAPSRMNWASH